MYNFYPNNITFYNLQDKKSKLYLSFDKNIFCLSNTNYITLVNNDNNEKNTDLQIITSNYLFFNLLNNSITTFPFTNKIIQNPNIQNPNIQTLKIPHFYITLNWKSKSNYLFFNYQKKIFFLLFLNEKIYYTCNINEATEFNIIIN